MDMDEEFKLYLALLNRRWPLTPEQAHELARLRMIYDPVKK
jgi:hypothetical protein